MRSRGEAWGQEARPGTDRPSPPGAATPSTPAAAAAGAGDTGGDLGPSEIAAVARAPGPTRLAPSLGSSRPAGALRRRTDRRAGLAAGWAGLAGR